MNLEDLRAAQTRERATDGLQELRDSFYEEVADYLRELEETRDEAAAEADDPFRSEDVQRLTDEIETAEQVAEAIYERRMGKIVKQASLAAAGMSANADGLTAEERDLYGDLVDRIEANKRHVLDVIAGKAESNATTDESAASPMDAGEPEPPAGGETVAPSEPADPEPSESSAAAAMGSESSSGPTPPSEEPPRDAGDVDEPEATSDEPDTARTTVRITQDVGEIFGLDERTYTLEADDVVTLPKENADPLVERDAAEELTPE